MNEPHNKSVPQDTSDSYCGPIVMGMGRVQRDNPLSMESALEEHYRQFNSEIKRRN